jgi:hypothetical protein
MALLARRWHVVGTVGTSLAPLAGRWHVFFFPDVSSPLAVALLQITLIAMLLVIGIIEGLALIFL